MPKDLRSDQARETLGKSVLEVQRRFRDGLPILDPIENMGINDEKKNQGARQSKGRARHELKIGRWDFRT